MWRQIYKQHLESLFSPPFSGCNWLGVLVDLILTLASGPKQMFWCISCLSSCAGSLCCTVAGLLRGLQHRGESLWWCRGTVLSSAAARTARTGLTGPPGWGAAGKNLLCSQQSMQHDCISAHAAPILRLCVHARKKKQKTSDSPCSDGGAGQSRRIHTSETHAKRVIMVHNWWRCQILKSTFILDSGASDLGVRSLHKCGRSLVSHTRLAVEKPLLIVLSHLWGFNLHARGLSSPAPWKNSQWTPSEAVDSCIQMKPQVIYVSNTASKAPFHIPADLQCCVLSWYNREASAFQTAGWTWCPSLKSIS